MTKKTRTVLFVFCVILFLLIAPSVVFYSQGYRFDFENKKMTQTGGLFLKVIPKQVEIYLDGKLKEKTDFFFGSALIENLLPKKYKIRVEKVGFLPWKKTLEIKEGGVAEAKNIVLIPENPNFTILAKEVESFWFSPNGEKIIIKEIEKNRWALKLYDLERNVKSHLVDEEDINQKGADLFSLEFSPDSKKISLEVGAKEKIKYLNLEIDITTPVLTESEKPPLPFEVVTYKTIGPDVYYLDNSGFLSKADSSFELKTKIAESPFPIKQETEYELYVFPRDIFLRESKILYIFNPGSKSFEKLFEPMRGIKISPDLKKLIYFSESEIWILFLDSDPQTGYQKGDRVFLTRFSEKIGEVFWFTPHYLILNVGDKIKIAEIDERDRIQIWELGSFKEPKIFWNQKDKKLYLLSEGNLYLSESLIK